MSSEPFLHEGKDFKALVETVADSEKINDPALVEKDYWIMHAVFGLKQLGLTFELKGGTSLSKGFGIIHRFSEDIDIRIEPFDGLEVDTNPNHEKPQHVESRRQFFVKLRDKLKIPGITAVERDMTLAGICKADPDLLLATPFQTVDLTKPSDQEKGIRWWEELTAAGGEGMVVKPLEFVTKGRKGLTQPAVKVRGREYLRIIYGPEYTMPDNLQRLKSRGLSAKRSLALREFSLGLEALERFVQKEPLRRVHECVFGVLALESEPVDPRL